VTSVALGGGDDVLSADIETAGCAVLVEGSVWCWNQTFVDTGDYGVFRYYWSGFVPNLTDVRSISMRRAGALAIREDGTVWRWHMYFDRNNRGFISDPLPISFPGNAHIVSISMGWSHSCAISEAGLIYCWGANYAGQLGITGGSRSEPTLVPEITDAISVSAGTLQTCALRISGDVWCWGYSDIDPFGRDGVGGTKEPLLPARVSGLSEVVSVSAGGENRMGESDPPGEVNSPTCALLQNSSVTCWSSLSPNERGELDQEPLDVFGDLDDVAAVSVGLRWGPIFAVRENGNVVLSSGSTFVPISGFPIGQAQMITVDLPLGLHWLTASYAGSTALGPSTSASLGLLVHDRPDAAAQAITFLPIPSRPYAPQHTVTLTANATSSLPVVFASLTPAVCSVTGSAAMMLAAGRCTIAATQPGNADYLPAVPKQQSFQISRGSQTLSFAAIPRQILTQGATVALTASASSGLPVVFSSQTPAVCSTVAATVTLLATGDCVIEASQPGDANWLGASPVIRSFAIIPETIISLTGPSSAVPGERVTLRAHLTTAGSTPTGTVTFRRDGVTLASAPLDSNGVAQAMVTTLPVGRHQITANYPGTTVFAPATSASLAVTVAVLDIGFLGGGAVFAMTEACSPALGSVGEPVTVRYSPSELGGLPSGVSIVWRTGSEHLALWGPMAPTDDFLGGAGRGNWTRFIFYPTRPLVRVVSRQITAPVGAGLTTAQELVLRMRVQNFAAIPGCSATLAAVLRRG